MTFLVLSWQFRATTSSLRTFSTIVASRSTKLQATSSSIGSSSAAKLQQDLHSKTAATSSSANTGSRLAFLNFFRKRKHDIPKITKVITDIDDTVVSSGGVRLFGIKLGGIDNRYKRGQVYPGVIQFALELSRSNKKFTTNKPAASAAVAATGTPSDPANTPSKVAVLTARAREFKFALALKSSGKLCTAYRTVGKSNGLEDWGIGDVYYGSVAEWILQGRKGLRKFKNFEIMMENDELLHRELDQQYILIGDTGEKDEEAGERMATNYPQKVKAVFLHSVATLKAKRGQSINDVAINVPTDRKVNGVSFFYFRTYVGAALKAYNHKLISREGVTRVAEQAVKELKSIDHTLAHAKGIMVHLQKKKIAEMQQLRWKELEADITSCEFLKYLLK